MIHECLFNLFNNPDSESLSETYNWTSLFELQEFLHPGEQKLIQTIVEIALDYHKIVAFTKNVLIPTPNVETTTTQLPERNVPSGLYITAFCTGVYKVLDNYRKETIALEDMFLQNPQLSLTFILSKIERYRTLFQVLLSMINIIENDNVHGCLLIGRLHKYVSCGVDQIVTAADEIIKSMNTVFYRHLCNWIIYGDLIDTYEEFFIRDGKNPDENFLYPEQMAELATENLTSLSVQKRKIRRPSIVRNFFINWQMVPLFISEDLAESILFMGRIVWIIRHGPNKPGGDNNYQIEYKRDIWEGQDVEYYKKLQLLESQPFNNIEFQKTIEDCRVKLTKYLWSIMLEEGNLVKHLHLIRDYYALGRGELFQQFIRVAEDHLKDTSSDLIVQNLNFIFHETARKIYGENDKTYLKFELTSSSEVTRTNPWSRLQLNFEIDWPLHIVFHPKVMELYNKLFCYLLKLRKTQIDLHKLWADQVSEKRKIDRRVWTLRQNLMFLVNNLQYYLQVDVIEAHFSLLLKAVENANGFEDIIKVHHEFISSLLAKTFVSTPNQERTCQNKRSLYQVPAVQYDIPSRVYNIIIKLLELCDHFCLVANTWDSELADVELEELIMFQNQTDVVIESLLFILQKLHEKASGQHLLQLLSQLDFNRYFSKYRADLNSSLI
ncbi:gamma-tubulin complex component 4 [Diabrotica virgifera virgifera]|uniref:Gamma-tubulin complex component n=2 Tax=Diabrotica virgifera virgifera TaxID=50390 RepID=A0ABM5KZ61_DIAVI|nr:gamma-tubulin complex component 4 [Diabrotica virgifera virgifera]